MFFDNGVFGIFKIQKYQSAYGTGSLVKQAAALSVILVFGKLTDLRQLDRRRFPIVVPRIDDGRDQCFECRGGGQSASAEHIRNGIRVKAADGDAPLCEPRRDPAYHRDGLSFFTGTRDQIVKLDDPHIVPLGFEADDPFIVE